MQGANEVVAAIGNLNRVQLEPTLNEPEFLHQSGRDVSR